MPRNVGTQMLLQQLPISVSIFAFLTSHRTQTSPVAFLSSHRRIILHVNVVRKASGTIILNSPEQKRARNRCSSFIWNVSELLSRLPLSEVKWRQIIINYGLILQISFIDFTTPFTTPFTTNLHFPILFLNARCWISWITILLQLYLKILDDLWFKDSDVKL